MQDKEWVPIYWLHVEYVKGDPLGYILAWSSMTPMFVLVMFLTLIAFKRDLHTISYAMGLLFNEAINWALKHTIKEPRPSKGRTGFRTAYGMPSSHAQFMFFFAVYLIHFINIRVHHNTWKGQVWKYILSIGGLLSAFIVGYSRIYLECHTVKQVLVGGFIGSICGTLWFFFVHLVLTPFFPSISSWGISEHLMLRDNTLIPNVMLFEYMSQRSEARSRQRKQQGTKSS